jgi:hypothetical protein
VQVTYESTTAASSLLLFFSNSPLRLPGLKIPLLSQKILVNETLASFFVQDKRANLARAPMVWFGRFGTAGEFVSDFLGLN